jgi:antitoxin component YwqK of YwqJK toxin-antitoxin module
MKPIVTLLILLIGLTSIAQSDINKTDANGKKQGVWKKAYPNVKVFKYVGQFKDDKPYGKFVYYYETGAVQAVIHFSNNGKLGRSQMYHNSGYLMAKGKYVNQLKDSTWIYFDDRGTISYQETYIKGKLEGQKVYFYVPKDGKLMIARYEYYKNGVKNGEFEEYHPNTKVKSKGKYLDGNLDGIVTHYYPNGKVKKVARYKYAVPHGYWAFYDEKGNQLGTKLYWEGKLLTGKAKEERARLIKEAKGK